MNRCSNSTIVTGSTNDLFSSIHDCLFVCLHVYFTVYVFKINVKEQYYYYSTLYIIMYANHYRVN